MTSRKRPRLKDDGYLAWLRELPCAVCGDNTSTEAAHIRTEALEYGKQHTGLGQKPSDTWVTPLCGRHHREQHTMNEMKFWKAAGMNPFVLALTLREVAYDNELAEMVIDRQRSTYLGN